MLRIYLDINAISNLRSGKRQQDVALLEFIRKNKTHLLLPYSDVMMRDLAHNYDPDDTWAKEMTETDLKFIAELSEHNLIASELNKSHPAAGVADPMVWFLGFVKKEEPLDVVAELVGMQHEPGELGEAGKKMSELMNTPNPFKLPQLAGTPMAEMFTGETYGEMIKNCLAFVDKMQQEPSKYRELRSYVTSTLQIGSHISGFKGNVLEQLDVLMKKGVAKKSFDELTQITLEQHNKKPGGASNWDRFLTIFSNLDIIGYNADKLENGYNNYMNDVQHGYLGAHCDFFVTEDKKTSEKTKRAIEKEGLSTKVFTVAELLEHVQTLEFQVSEAAIDKIVNGREMLISNLYFCSLKDRCEIQRCDLKNPLFNFFNQFTMMVPVDSEPTFIFERKVKNYSNFVFYAELQKMVDLMVDEFGPDSIHLGHYEPQVENAMVEQGKWKGRYWLLKDKFLFFYIPQGNSYPILSGRILVQSQSVMQSRTSAITQPTNIQPSKKFRMKIAAALRFLMPTKVSRK